MSRTIDADLRRHLERDAERIALLQQWRRRACGSRTCTARRRRRSGTKISQTPAGASRRIGCTRPSQPLKSPITLTRSAFGAHTAKCTPVVEPDVDAVRAELLEGAVMRAFAEQVQIEIGQHAAVAIRIVDLDGRVTRVRDPQSIVRDTRPILPLPPRKPDFENAGGISPVHRDNGLARHEVQVDAARRRLKCTDDDGAGVVAVRTQNGEWIAVCAAHERRHRFVDCRFPASWHLLHLIGFMLERSGQTR